MISCVLTTPAIMLLISFFYEHYAALWLAVVRYLGEVYLSMMR